MSCRRQSVIAFKVFGVFFIYFLVFFGFFFYSSDFFPLRKIFRPTSDRTPSSDCMRSSARLRAPRLRADDATGCRYDFSFARPRRFDDGGSNKKGDFRATREGDGFLHQIYRDKYVLRITSLLSIDHRRQQQDDFIKKIDIVHTFQ